LPDSIQGSLLLPKQDFDLAKLISLAQNNRTDIQMVIKVQEMSQNNLRLAKANRFIDLRLSIGGSTPLRYVMSLHPPLLLRASFQGSVFLSNSPISSKEN